jgi:hypothetical protein
MLQGSSLLVQIQIALIGIVVIASMFFMWRSLARLEERIDQLTSTTASCCPKPLRQQCSDTSKYPDEDEYAAQMMKVFGTENPFDFVEEELNDDVHDESSKCVPVPVPVPVKSVLTFTIPSSPPSLSKFEDIHDINDIAESLHAVKISAGSAHVEVASQAVASQAPSQAVASQAVSPVQDDDVSEAETDAANPLSKARLKRMNVERLKELCMDRGMSVDGTKQQLIDRILGLSRD